MKKGLFVELIEYAPLLLLDRALPLRDLDRDTEREPDLDREPENWIFNMKYN